MYIRLLVRSSITLTFKFILFAVSIESFGEETIPFSLPAFLSCYVNKLFSLREATGIYQYSPPVCKMAKSYSDEPIKPKVKNKLFILFQNLCNDMKNPSLSSPSRIVGGGKSYGLYLYRSNFYFL